MTQLLTAAQIKPIARTGFVAKGMVYLLLGALAIMAASGIGNQSANTGKQDVLNTIKEQTGGQILLAVLALGLLCYSAWRFVQCFYDTERKGRDTKAVAVRTRYLFSGLTYLSFALYAFKLLFAGSGGGKNGRQGIVQEVLSKPFGDSMVGMIALIMIGNGIYQGYYGLSEKYRKHVAGTGSSINNKVLLIAGKAGYPARGIVWLIIGWMFLKAAIHSNSSEAGDTSKAFGFLANAAYGSYLLGAVALGLIFYGIFNFIRARYEQFSS
jgi:hypothetical protein